MTSGQNPAEAAEAEILDAELHADSRLRFIQRRLQEDEGLRMTIDNISYVLRLSAEYDERHGISGD